jgi:hypothetical protein
MTVNEPRRAPEATTSLEATTSPEPAEPAVPAASEEEVERLRREVEDLRGRLSEPDAADPESGAAPPRPRRGWWRPVVATVLIFVAAVLAPASIVARFASDQIGDTDRYVETVTPLATDPAVQDAIVARISKEILDRIDVKAITQQAVGALQAQGLSPQIAASLTALSVPLQTGVENFVTQQVTKIVHSPEFASAWVQANRQAHTQMVAILTGQDTDSVTVTGDSVQVNLGPVVAQVKQRLVTNGFSVASRIPPVRATFTLVQSDDITKAQRGFRLLKGTATGLPIVAILLIVGAVFVARDRRLALIGAGLAVLAGMLLLGGLLNVFRSVYLDNIPTATSKGPAAAAAVYDTFTHLMRLNLRAVAVVALAVAAGAWLAGSKPAPRATRDAVVGSIAWLRGGSEHMGLRTGPVGAFVYRSRSLLRALVIGVAVLVYVLAAHPTGGWTIKVLAVTVLVLVVVEFLARPPAVAPADAVDEPVPAA